MKISKNHYIVSSAALGKFTAHHNTGDYKVFDTREEALSWAAIQNPIKAAEKEAKRNAKRAAKAARGGK